MKIFRTFLVAFCMFLVAGAVFSADLTATIREFSGKVETKTPNGQWIPVKVGDVLSAGDSISTGFNSKAVMVLGDTSVLVAKDLTRLTLSELYKKEDTVVTDLFLDIGNIRSEVHSSNSVANDFKVRSTNTTASVRGTVIDVEVMGDGKDMKVMAWDGMAKVQANKTKRVAFVGEQKKRKIEAETTKTEEKADSDEQAKESAVDLGTPSEPPANIATAPVISIGNGAGMVTSLSSTISATSVSVSTKPPAPTEVSTGGGSSVTTDASSVVSDSLDTTSPGNSKPTTTNITISVTWPE